MKHTSALYHMTLCAVMTALFCIFGPLALPVGPIPISLTNLVLYLSVYLLRPKDATISYLIYLLLGAVGLPVFSGYVGGFTKLVGPTGGYLIGFLLTAPICSFFLKQCRTRLLPLGIGMTLATLIAYGVGTLWFIAVMRCSVRYALTVCVFPFIPFDLIKISLALLLGKTLRQALQKACLLS